MAAVVGCMLTQLHAAAGAHAHCGLPAQVRDMTGDGGVVKKRLREGGGEFPVDCPLHDTTVRLHFRARQLPAGGGGPPGPWLYDSRAAGGTAGGAAGSSGGSGSLVDDPAAGSGGGDADDAASGSAAAAAAAAAGAVEADTGCGELPEGLEMALKLMVPGEVASAVCQPKYAYQVRRCIGRACVCCACGRCMCEGCELAGARAPAGPPRTHMRWHALMMYWRITVWRRAAPTRRPGSAPTRLSSLRCCC